MLYCGDLGHFEMTPRPTVVAKSALTDFALLSLQPCYCPGLDEIHLLGEAGLFHIAVKYVNTHSPNLGWIYTVLVIQHECTNIASESGQKVSQIRAAN